MPAPAWNEPVSQLKESMAQVQTEIKNLQENSKILGTQVDDVRSVRQPELIATLKLVDRQLSELKGQLEKVADTSRGELKTAIEKIEKQLEWHREVWKALALIVVTAVIAAIVGGIKDVMVKNVSPVPPTVQKKSDN